MSGGFRPSLPGERRGGRKKGTPNKLDASIKDMVVTALHNAGGAAYLTEQAHVNPTAFMTLVGRVLPLQLAGHDGGRLEVEFRWQDASDDAVPPPSPPYNDVPSLARPGRAEPHTTIIDGNAVDVEPPAEAQTTDVTDETTITFIGEC